MIKTENEAADVLQSLNKTLCDLEKPTELNFFDACGMSTQEVKHSTFFAWLLSPTQSHNNGSAFLYEFVKALYEYPSVNDNAVLSNADILSQSLTFEKLASFANADDITVETEKVIDDAESRIDIFIQSKKTDTVLVIENKVFSSAHDDQLNRYAAEVEKIGVSKTRKKIFVYLTPFGKIPTDINGEYQQGWCMFDYGALIGILKQFASKLKNPKLKYFIEDYISMVDNKILHNNPKIRALCKKICREHSEAIEILRSYIDNVDLTYRYIATKWLPRYVPEVSKFIYRGRKLVFVTPAITNYYDKNLLDINVGNEIYRLQISVTSKDGPIAIAIWLSKAVKDKWSAADIAVRDILQPQKYMGEKYCTLYSRTILSEEEREKVFETDGELYGLIDERLAEFLVKLNEFESKLPQ